MKVLYHHRTRCSGADGTHIQGIAGGFRKKGYAVDIVSLVSDGRRKKDASSGGKHGALRLPRVIVEFFEFLYSIPAAFILWMRQRGRSYDIIYERYAFLNFAGAFISRITGTPLFVEANFTMRTQVCPERTGFFSVLENAVERFVFSQASLIVVITRELKEDISSHGIDGNKIVVVPNAVDPDRFRVTEQKDDLRLKYGIGPEEKLICFVGNFFPWHGVDFMIDVFKAVLDDGADSRLILIGDGQEKVSLQRKVDADDLKERVMFIGAVEHQRLPSYLNMCDICVMPDSNNYGSPMKIFEYMAMSRPLVAPRLSPIEAVVTDGKEGLLFARRDKAEFAGKLKLLLGDPGLCLKMGRAGKEKVWAQHTWEKNVEKILAQYAKTKIARGEE